MNRSWVTLAGYVVVQRVGVGFREHACYSYDVSFRCKRHGQTAEWARTFRSF